MKLKKTLRQCTSFVLALCILTGIAMPSIKAVSEEVKNAIETVYNAIQDETTTDDNASIEDKTAADDGTLEKMLRVPYAATPSPEVSGTQIFANGLPIKIIAGQSDATKTNILWDKDGDGVIGDNEYLKIGSSDPTDAGYDLSVYSIFGGSNSATVTGDTSITMTGGTVNIVYGGGLKGAVSGSTTVTVSGGTVKNNVYGGGNSDTVSGTVSGTSVTVSGGTVKYVYGGGFSSGATVGTGGTTVTISGGKVTYVYGGGFSSGVSGNAMVEISQATTTTEVSYVYGGGYSGTVNGTSVTVSGGTVKNNVYGGGNSGRVDDSTEVKIKGGTVDKVYGGGYYSVVSGNATVEISQATTTITEVGTVYGGSDSATVNGSTTVTVSGGTVKNSVYGGGNSGRVDDSTEVKIKGGTVTNSVYGGGYGGVVSGNATVEISQATTTKTEVGTVYGGGENTNGITGYGAVGSTEVKILGGTVDKVYGGGNSRGATVGGTTVTVSGGTVDKVYGGGASGNVTNAAEITISGNANISGTVYGGGDSGEVYGGTSVTVSGGRIGGASADYGIAKTNKLIIAGPCTIIGNTKAINDDDTNNAEVKEIEFLPNSGSFDVRAATNVNLSDIALRTISTNVADYSNYKYVEFILAIGNADATQSIISFVYDTTSKTPNLELTYGGKKLIEDADYTVSGTTTSSAVGEYKIIVTGKGSYGGTKEISWHILPGSLPPEINYSEYNITKPVETTGATSYTYMLKDILTGAEIGTLTLSREDGEPFDLDTYELSTTKYKVEVNATNKYVFNGWEISNGSTITNTILTDTADVINKYTPKLVPKPPLNITPKNKVQATAGSALKVSEFIDSATGLQGTDTIATVFGDTLSTVIGVDGEFEAQGVTIKFFEDKDCTKPAQITEFPTSVGTYYYTVAVTADIIVGNYNVKALQATNGVITLEKKSSGGGGSTTPPSNGNVDIVVDGNVENIGKQEETKNGVKVTLDQEKATEKIQNAKKGSSFVVSINSKKDTVTAELVVKNVADMAAKNMTLEVKTEKVTYKLPTTAVDIQQFIDAFGKDVDLSKAPISITISNTDESKQQQINNTANADGFTVVNAPIDFTITANYNGKTIEVKNFSKYVTREIEISAEDAAKITTAIVYEEDGSVRHIPTEVLQREEKHFACVNSITNSTYVLIYNEQEFVDVDGKWFADLSEEMASRKVMNGVGNDVFAGERDITRAEFAAIVVRALGLPRLEQSTFSDVDSNSWYSVYVASAAKYSIVNGIGNNKFNPSSNITREEAMQMIYNASKVASYERTSEQVPVFSDYGNTSNWAKEAVDFNLGNGLIVGSNGKIRQKENITRAETAAVVLRLLQKAKLIDIRS